MSNCRARQIGRLGVKLNPPICRFVISEFDSSKLSSLDSRILEQGSASGTGFPGSRSPGSGNLGPGPEPGLIQDLRDEGFRDSTLGDCPGD